MDIGRRSGLLAKKISMARIFDEETGNSIGVTAMHILECKVIEKKEQESSGYNAVVLGVNDGTKISDSKPMKGIFKKRGQGAFSMIKEFRVSRDGLIEVGNDLNISHFSDTDFVDISGVSKGKGFQGVMKRHNFGGLRASHGVSKAHRSHGSTGTSRNNPGRVFKGKRMAGHMGNVRVTKQNLKIVKMDNENNIIYVKGSVPGANNSVVEIKDAVKKKIVKKEAGVNHNEA